MVCHLRAMLGDGLKGDQVVVDQVTVEGVMADRILELVVAAERALEDPEAACRGVVDTI